MVLLLPALVRLASMSDFLADVLPGTALILSLVSAFSFCKTKTEEGEGDVVEGAISDSSVSICLRASSSRNLEARCCSSEPRRNCPTKSITELRRLVRVRLFWEVRVVFVDVVGAAEEGDEEEAEDARDAEDDAGAAAACKVKSSSFGLFSCWIMPSSSHSE